MRLLAMVVALLLLAIAPTLTVRAAAPTGTAAARFASPAGLWEPVDSSGKSLGLIRIFEVNGLYYGRIEPSSPTDDRTALCTRCKDERHNQPIIGLVLMRHLKLVNGEYVGGDILDPDTGRIYGCALHLTDGGRHLIMRGFLGFSLLGQSQTWRRVADHPR
ncbi:MAG TPA: DUF2147 domain-containing protein [Steroidobacteraceae bacterium]|nr:DUF2147 domain-containing protein [Steroidobacteraceae bacterium]